MGLIQILTEINIDNIVQRPLKAGQYYTDINTKKQLVLHHTVSGDGIDGDLNWWNATTDRIATSIIVSRDGTINQCFKTNQWAHHLGIKTDFLKTKGFKDYQSRNLLLNKQSIGIEIDSWGGLVKHTDGKFYPALTPTTPNLKAKPIDAINVANYPNGFRGYKYFEKYTDKQLTEIGKLLLYFGRIYTIPLTYNADMFQVNMKALNGNAGIWSHVSYREDKSDCHPQQELIDMLKAVQNYHK